MTKIAHNYIRIKGASGNRHAPHITTPQLLNSDSLHLWQLLTTLTLWESDFKHTVAHLCRNLILVNTLWEVENLSERCVRELTTEIVMLLILRAVLITATLLAISILLNLFLQQHQYPFLRPNRNLKTFSCKPKRNSR